jgi:hypothetical protein
MTAAKNSTEVLKAVEWIITNIGWTQFASYRSENGNPIGSSTDRSISEELYSEISSVCLTGAIGLVDASSVVKNKAIDRLIKASGGRGIMRFNDNAYDKQEVIDLIHKAMETE